MAFQLRVAAGYSCSEIFHVSADEYAYVCGNTVVLKHRVSHVQRILRGTGFGIQAIAVNVRHGYLAVADKGPEPIVHVYHVSDLSEVSRVRPNFKLGVSTLAFSRDGSRLAVCSQEPDPQVAVWRWHEGELLVSAPLPQGLAPATQVTFHPYDHDRLLSTGGGATLLWSIQRLWDKMAFKPTRIAEVQEDGNNHTCHAWHVGGAFLGTSAGQVLCVPAAQLWGKVAHHGHGHAASGAHAAAEAAGGGLLHTLPSAPVATDPMAALEPAMHDQEHHADPPLPAADAPLVSAPSVPHPTLLQRIDAFDAPAPITTLSLSRDLLVVGGSERVAWFVYGSILLGSASEPPQPYHSFSLGMGVTVTGLSLGGSHFATLMVGCSDGRLLQLDGPAPPHLPHAGSGNHHYDMQHTDSWDNQHNHLDSQDFHHGPRPALATFLPAAEPTAQLVVDSHVGKVSGVVTHPTSEAVVTCGVDGTLRVWQAATGQLLHRRTFSAALTALALAPQEVPMVAVGSETGVLRLVVLRPDAESDTQALQVIWRRRLHQGPVTSMVFSPDGHMLATAGQDKSIWFSSVNLKEGTLLPLGQLSCPEPILCLTWPEVQDAEDCIMVSLASGGVLAASAPVELHAAGRPSQATDMQLTAKDVTIKVVKLEVPLMSMVAVPGEKYGELLGLGLDTAVHRVVLPTEGQAWAGLKGRVHKSTTRACVHGRAEGTACLTPSKQLLVTGTQDGCIVTHTVSLMTLGTVAALPLFVDSSRPQSQASTASADALRAGLHDVTNLGTAGVAFDHSGRYLVSLGCDGSLFVYETLGGAHLTRTLPLAPGIVPPGPLLLEAVATTLVEDADAWDDPQEPTEAALAAKGGQSGASKHHATTKLHAEHTHSGQGSGEVLSRLQQLKTALVACVDANEQAPDLEKVEKADFLIDRQLMAQLQAEADKHVAGVRNAAKAQDTTLEVIAARVLHSCWTSMAVRGEALAGINDPAVTVDNFPMIQDEVHEKALSKVVFLRKMEMVEQRQLAVAAAHATLPVPHSEPDPSSQAGVPATDSSHDPNAPPAASRTAPSGSGGHANRQQSMAGLPEGETVEDLLDEWAAAGNKVNVERLMYSDMELNTLSRKAAQSHFLRQQIYDIKRSYNEEWSKMVKQKRNDADKIADLNVRMEEIVKELGRLGVAAPSLDDLRFIVPWPEDMSRVLTVKDEEVQVDRGLFGDGSSGAPGAGGGGSGGASGMAGGEAGAAERALRQMMGGTLAAREEEGNEYVLIRPDWMDGNPKLFSEEQQKEFKEFLFKERVMAEEKAKRIAVLELELRTVRTAAEDTATHFDEMLQALSLKRARALQDVCALEVRCIRLAAAVDSCMAANEDMVREVLHKMTQANDQRVKIVSELNEKKQILMQMETQLADLVAEDRQLDKNFKKEFADTEHFYARLLHLFRLRVSKDTTGDRGKLHRQNSNHPSEGGYSLHSHAQGAGAGAGRVGTASTLNRQALGSHAAHSIVHRAPVSHLAQALANPVVHEVQMTTYDPWPELPVSVQGGIPSSSMEPGALPPHQEEEPEQLDDSHCPEGLGEQIWIQFQAYRAAKVHGEAEIRKLQAGAAVLRLEVPQLEATAATLQATADQAMGEVQRMRNARKTALQDCSMQLRLKAGQVEVCPGPHELVAPDDDQALLVHRSRVEGLNTAVQAKGERKVEMLRQIKDFSRGMHHLKWEAARCDLKIQELRETVRDLQLLHVTRDMQAAYQKDGQDVRAADKLQTANEQQSLENLARQRDKLHKKALSERARTLKSMGQTIQTQASQNTDVARHLVQLQKVLEEQQRLRASMADSNEVAGKKMRSLVTHKKLKEIAMAQAQEIRALTSELDRLRLKTYPTFVEPSAALFPADTRLPPALTHHHQLHHTSPNPTSPGGLLPLNRSHPHLNFGQAAALRR